MRCCVCLGCGLWSKLLLWSLLGAQGALRDRCWLWGGWDGARASQWGGEIDEGDSAHMPLVSAPRVLPCVAKGLSWPALFLGSVFISIKAGCHPPPGLLRGWWPPGPAESTCLLTPPLSVYGGGTDETNTVVGPGWLPHKTSIQATLGCKIRGESRVRYKLRSGQDLVQTESETGHNNDRYFVSSYYILDGTEGFPGIISVISSTHGSRPRG